MITIPTLLVDEKRCKANILRMADKAARHGLIFRPHFKTHQSHEIGRWFREAGVSKITCSSLTMAKYFAEDGWDDITVAFPVNVLEVETINELASRIALNILVESVESVQLLEKGLKYPVNAFVKLDLGTHRTGIDPENVDYLNLLIEEIKKSTYLNFAGFLGHSGHSYGARGRDEIMDVHRRGMDKLVDLRSQFPEALISYGDTPTCSHAEDFGPVDELRPGNFAFYDIMQEQIGSCTYDQVAVAMACPVVAKHPERGEVVVYGGGVHFSKDSIEMEGKKRFGQVVSDEGNGWGSPVEGVYLGRISQEHGIIKAPYEYIDSIRIGDIVKVLPVHSCMTMDLLRDFRVV